MKICREISKLAEIYIKSWRCNAVISLRLKWYQDLSLSVSTYVSALLSLDGFLWNLILEIYMKIWRKIPNCVQIGQKYRELYMKISIGFIVAGDTEAPWRLSWTETTSRFQSIRSSTPQYQRGSYWRNLREICYWGNF